MRNEEEKDAVSHIERAREAVFKRGEEAVGNVVFHQAEREGGGGPETHSGLASNKNAASNYNWHHNRPTDLVLLDKQDLVSGGGNPLLPAANLGRLAIAPAYLGVHRSGPSQPGNFR